MCVKNGESREEDNYEKEIFRNRNDRSFERNVPVRVRGMHHRCGRQDLCL